MGFAYLFDSAEDDEEIVNLILEIEIVEIYRGKVRDLLEPIDPKTRKEKNITLRDVPDLVKDPEKKRKAEPEEETSSRRRRRRKKKTKKKVAKEKKDDVPKKIQLTGTF